MVTPSYVWRDLWETSPARVWAQLRLSLSPRYLLHTSLSPFSHSSHSSSPSGFILLLFSSPRSLSSVSKDPECVLSLWAESRDREEVWGERVDVWKSVRARIGLWSSFLRTTLPRWYHIHRNLVCLKQCECVYIQVSVVSVGR